MEEIDKYILKIWSVWLNDASNLSDADRGARNVREFLNGMVRHGLISGKATIRQLSGNVQGIGMENTTFLPILDLGKRAVSLK